MHVVLTSSGTVLGLRILLVQVKHPRPVIPARTFHRKSTDNLLLSLIRRRGLARTGAHPKMTNFPKLTHVCVGPRLSTFDEPGLSTLGGVRSHPGGFHTSCLIRASLEFTLATLSGRQRRSLRARNLMSLSRLFLSPLSLSLSVSPSAQSPGITQRRKKKSNPSGKSSQERLTRSTVISTYAQGQHVLRGVRGTVLALVVRLQDPSLNEMPVSLGVSRQK